MTESEGRGFVGVALVDAVTKGEDNELQCAALKAEAVARETAYAEAEAIVEKERVAADERLATQTPAEAKAASDAQAAEQAKAAEQEAKKSAELFAFLQSWDAQRAAAETVTTAAEYAEADEAPEAATAEADAELTMAAMLGFYSFSMASNMPRLRSGLALKRAFFPYNGHFVLADENPDGDEEHPRLWAVAINDWVLCKYEPTHRWKWAEVVGLRSSTIDGSSVVVRFDKRPEEDTLSLAESDVRERLRTREQARYVVDRECKRMFGDMMWELRKLYLPPKGRENLELAEELKLMRWKFNWSSAINEDVGILQFYRNFAEHTWWKELLAPGRRKDDHPVKPYPAPAGTKYKEYSPKELQAMSKRVLEVSQRAMGGFGENDGAYQGRDASLDQARREAMPLMRFFDEMMWDLRTQGGQSYLQYCKRACNSDSSNGFSRLTVKDELALMGDYFHWDLCIRQMVDELRNGEKCGRNYFEHEYERNLIEREWEALPNRNELRLSLRAKRACVLAASKPPWADKQKHQLDGAASLPYTSEETDMLLHWLDEVYGWRGC